MKEHTKKSTQDLVGQGQLSILWNQSGNQKWSHTPPSFVSSILMWKLCCSLAANRGERKTHTSSKPFSTRVYDLNLKWTESKKLQTKNCGKGQGKNVKLQLYEANGVAWQGHILRKTPGNVFRQHWIGISVSQYGRKRKSIFKG